MNHIGFAILLCLVTLNLDAQILKTVLISKSVHQYQKAEWEVVLNTTWNNPYAFNEIALDMNLTAPSGKQIILPCYYESGKSEGESVWKARFAARETGTYSYKFALKKEGKEVSVSPNAEFKVIASSGKGFLSPNNLWTFRYDNGELFRGIGENICWESRDSDDSKFFKTLHEEKRFNYDFMLAKLAANGGNFFRTWMIYWNLPIDWKTVKNNSRYQNTSSPYNESGMKRMDQLVKLCDSLGIHMMLALESHAGYLGTGWELSNYNIANGGSAKTPYDFFTLIEAKQQYKNKLRLMVARYGYSPSIGAWEFFNEIDNAMYNGKPGDQLPASIITLWHDEMSTFLKSIDPYEHMVTTSISHRDVEGLNDLKSIDFNQKHIYKNTAGIPETINRYTKKHNKPYVIGEAGYEWDWSKNFNDFAGEMDSDFKRALWYGLFNPTPILPMSWWWEFFENRGMMSYLKQVSKMNRLMLQAGDGQFKSIEVKAVQEEWKTYGVQSGNTKFVYLYNPTETTSGIEFTMSETPEKSGEMKLFDCESGSYSKTKYIIMPDKRIRIEGHKLLSKMDVIVVFN